MNIVFQFRVAAVVVALALALILPGCGGGGSVTPAHFAPTSWLPPDQEGIALRESSGLLSLPPGSPLRSEEFQVFTSFGTGQVDAEGQFAVLNNSETNQLLLALKPDGSPGLLGLTALTAGQSNNRGEEALDLSARTTAVTLVFLSPGIASPDRERAALVLQALDGIPELDALEEAITTALLGSTPLAESSEVRSALDAAVQAAVVALGGQPVSARVTPTERRSHVLVGVEDDTNPASLQFSLSNFGLRYLQVFQQNLDSQGQPVGAEEPVNLLSGLVSSADDLSFSSVLGGIFSGQIVAPSEEPLTGVVSNSSGAVRYSVWGPGLIDTGSVDIEEFITHASLATGATALFNLVGPTVDTVVGIKILTRGRGRPTNAFRTAQRINELINLSELMRDLLEERNPMPLMRAVFGHLLGSDEGRVILRDLAHEVGFEGVSAAFLRRLAVHIAITQMSIEVINVGGTFYHLATSRPLEQFVGSPGASRSVFRVTLTWDQATDMDLHLFAPGGEHSFFGNKAISMGALDFDDRDGFGPEHFTTSALVPGVYRVAVDYFSGQVPTRCFVTVATAHGSQQFSRELTSCDQIGGPLPSGDTESWWWVADLHVDEDGLVTITPPDQTEQRSGFERGMNLKL